MKKYEFIDTAVAQQLCGNYDTFVIVVGHGHLLLPLRRLFDYLRSYAKRGAVIVRPSGLIVFYLRGGTTRKHALGYLQETIMKRRIR